jgi:mannose PTS system EIIA component
MIGILIVTHGEIGRSFIDSSSHILGKSIDLLECIPIDPKTDVMEIQKLISNEIINFNQLSGVLIMTDIYGATPSNLLTKFIIPGEVEVITGLNLSMLIQAISHRKSKLPELVDVCIEYAKDGILKISDK